MSSLVCLFPAGEQGGDGLKECLALKGFGEVSAETSFESAASIQLSVCRDRHAGYGSRAVIRFQFFK